jgi:hypothetical protein
MNDEDFRDACAMFAMVGLLFNENYEANCLSDMAFHIADKMVAQRNKEPEQEVGIVAAKPRRKKSA